MAAKRKPKAKKKPKAPSFAQGGEGSPVSSGAPRPKYFLNANKGSSRKGQHYTMGAGGSHVYTDPTSGKRSVVGGKKPAPKPSVKALGGGSYLNQKANSPRKGQKFKLDAYGNHVYNLKGKKVVIGKKGPAKAAGPAPYDPTAPLSGAQFDAEVNADTELKYGQAQRDLQERVRGVDATNAAQQNAWQDYINMVGRNNANTQAGYASAGQQVQGVNANSQQQSEATRQQVQAQMDKGRQDTGFQGSSSMEGVAAQAAASRAQSGNNQQTLLASQGATQNAYGNDIQRIGALVKAQAQTSSDWQKQKYQQQINDLLKEKGQYAVTQRGVLRGSEREWQAARAAYNLNVAKAGTDAATKNSAAKEKAKLRKQAAKDKAAARRLQLRQQNLSHRDRVSGQNLSHSDRQAALQYRKDHPTGAKKGTKGAKLLSDPKYGKSNVSKAKAVTNRAAWENIINTGGKTPPKGNALMIRAAKEYYGNSHKVSKATALKLYRTFGIRVPYYKAKPIKLPGSLGGITIPR